MLKLSFIICILDIILDIITIIRYSYYNRSVKTFFKELFNLGTLVTIVVTIIPAINLIVFLGLLDLAISNKKVFLDKYVCNF